MRAQTGHDFSLYKENTIHRRIERRMAVAQIERIEDYVRYLRRTPLEVETLFRELLIGVTSFFRDPPAVRVARNTSSPRLSRHASGESMRVWVPGCSTGEEAYSLAILFREHLDKRRAFPVQIFATDLDVEAIEKRAPGSIPTASPPMFRRNGWRASSPRRTVPTV